MQQSTFSRYMGQTMATPDFRKSSGDYISGKQLKGALVQFTSDDKDKWVAKNFKVMVTGVTETIKEWAQDDHPLKKYIVCDEHGTPVGISFPRFVFHGKGKKTEAPSGNVCIREGDVLSFGVSQVSGLYRVGGYLILGAFREESNTTKPDNFYPKADTVMPYVPEEKNPEDIPKELVLKFKAIKVGDIEKVVPDKLVYHEPKGVDSMAKSTRALFVDATNSMNTHPIYIAVRTDYQYFTVVVPPANVIFLDPLSVTENDTTHAVYIPGLAQIAQNVKEGKDPMTISIIPGFPVFHVIAVSYKPAKDETKKEEPLPVPMLKGRILVIEEENDPDEGIRKQITTVHTSISESSSFEKSVGIASLGHIWPIKNRKNVINLAKINALGLVNFLQKKKDGDRPLERKENPETGEIEIVGEQKCDYSHGTSDFFGYLQQYGFPLTAKFVNGMMKHMMNDDVLNEKKYDESLFSGLDCKKKVMC